MNVYFCDGEAFATPPTVRVHMRVVDDADWVAEEQYDTAYYAAHDMTDLVGDMRPDWIAADVAYDVEYALEL